ncbi:MAG: hypothetical protein AAB360_04040 [Patescibacteria group bacterium]
MAVIATKRESIDLLQLLRTTPTVLSSSQLSKQSVGTLGDETVVWEVRNY